MRYSNPSIAKYGRFTQVELENMNESVGLPNLIEVSKKNIAGVYKVYYNREDALKDGIIPKPEYWNSNKGDWIISDDGVIAQLLDINWARVYKIGYTPFGIDNLGRYGGYALHKEGKVTPQGLLLLRNRRYFSSLSNSDNVRGQYVTKRLTGRDKRILLFLLIFGNEIQAYEKATGLKATIKTKNAIQYRVRNIFQKDGAVEFMKNTLSEHLQKRGITEKQWLDKMIDSVGDTIDSSTKLSIWMTIGKLIPSVKEDVFGEGNDANQLTARFDTKMIQSADVTSAECQACQGSKTIESTDKITGQIVSIDCPICKNKDNSNKALYEVVESRPQQIGLKV